MSSAAPELLLLRIEELEAKAKRMARRVEAMGMDRDKPVHMMSPPSLRKDEGVRLGTNSTLQVSECISSVRSEEQKGDQEYVMLAREDLDNLLKREREEMEAKMKREREEVEDMVEALRKEHRQQNNPTPSGHTSIIEQQSPYLSQDASKRVVANASDMLKNQYSEEIISVKYCKQVGFLWASSECLCFAARDGSVAEKWAWKDLDRVTANAAMRITHVDAKKKSLFFEFEHPTDLMAIASDFRYRIADAQASQHVTDDIEAPEQWHDEEEEARSLLTCTEMKTVSKMSSKSGACSTGTSSTLSLDDLPQEQLVALMNKAIEQHENFKGEQVEFTGNAKFQQEDLMALMNKTIEQHEKDKEEKEKTFHAPYGETVYTLLYISRVNSQGFWYSIFVWAIQMAMIVLTLVDQIDQDASENRLQIPPMVDITVTMVQALSLFILLAYVSDLMEGVLKLQEGIYPEVREKHPAATFSKWLFSCIAQLLAGLLLVIASLIVTMAAETVIDVVLNLTALLFITELDDLGFALAKMGFITNYLQKEALSVEDIEVPRRKGVNLYRRVAYGVGLIGLFIGYAVLKQKQLAGDYLPTYIYVQFGDAYNSKIPYYSGILSSVVARTSERRQYRDQATENILLAYCQAENSWTFSETDDPCHYFAKSLETKTYDVTTLPDSDWEVKDSADRLQPFESFSLVNRDCNPNICKDNRGFCDAGLCSCPHDRFGMDCEFSDVCPTLTIDERYGQFPSKVVLDVPFLSGLISMVGFSQDFQILEDISTKEYVKVYDMPVYYSNSTYPANILFFGGLRWILTSELDLFNLTEATSQNPDTWFFPEKTIAALENNFHGHHQANYTPFFISDPVDFETPNFQPTPIGLGWFITKKDDGGAGSYVPDIPVDTVFTCSRPPPLPETCIDEPEGFCGVGSCNPETGFCECWIEMHGAVFGDRCNLERPCYEASCFGRGDCDGSSGFCRCNSPYHGKLCLQNYKCYEEYGSCKNGGICNMTTGVCDCPDPATTGEACEKRANCLHFGCANGGICGYDGSCICHPPFYGAHCDLVNKTQEELFCSKNEDCRNGSCDIDTGICACEDPVSYGTLCQHQFNCSEVVDVHYDSATPPVPVCLNDGICNTATGLCDCPEPYFGPDCSQVPTCLSNDDCGDPLGNDKCDIDTGFCHCFSGTLQGKAGCEKPPACSTDDDCFAQGVCKRDHCEECGVPGVGGNFCESLIAGIYPPRYDDLEAELMISFEHCGFEDPLCCDSEDPHPFCDWT